MLVFLFWSRLDDRQTRTHTSTRAHTTTHSTQIHLVVGATRLAYSARPRRRVQHVAIHHRPQLPGPAPARPGKLRSALRSMGLSPTLELSYRPCGVDSRLQQGRSCVHRLAEARWWRNATYHLPRRSRHLASARRQGQYRTGSAKTLRRQDQRQDLKRTRP